MTDAAAARPVAYAILIQTGWDWFTRRGSVSHLCPPNGDQARCGRQLARDRRYLDQSPTKASTCARCRAAVGLP